MSACVSDNVPGSKELQSFDKRAIAELGGPSLDPKNNPAPGVVLESQSVLTTRIQDPVGKNRVTASSISKTRITDIQEWEMPADTFLPSSNLREVKPHQPVAPGERDREEGLSI